MRPPRMMVAASAVLAPVALVAGCGGSSAPAVAPAANHVRVADFAFTPATITVHAGDSVTWDFAQPEAPHNVAVNDGPDQFTSGAPKGSGSFTHRFSQAGTFHYICVVHPSMKGSVTVTP